MLKTGIKHLIPAIFIIVGMGCHNTGQKTETAEEARERVMEATHHSLETQPDSLDEYELYTNEMDKQLQANELKISSFKTIIKLEPQAIQDKFKNQIELIELKNTQLKTMLTQYQFEEGNKWIVFKTSFNKQVAKVNQMITGMDELFIFNNPPKDHKH